MYYNFLSHNFLSLDFQIYRSIALRLEALNSDFFFLLSIFFSFLVLYGGTKGCRPGSDGLPVGEVVIMNCCLTFWVIDYIEHLLQYLSSSVCDWHERGSEMGNGKYLACA